VLEVSLETKDKGRGMNSKVSENPTRARFKIFAGGLLSGLMVLLESVDIFGSVAGGFSAESSEPGNSEY
jgi:hypothetical protein